MREARRASRGELEGSGKGYIGAGAARTRYTLIECKYAVVCPIASSLETFVASSCEFS